MDALIHSFDDFCRALDEVGFTPGSPNAEGLFSLCGRFGPQIAWHTEDPDTDPWAWRTRVLDERTDIAYAKLFFGKSGYVTRAWYPKLLASRRRLPFAQAYSDGLISQEARRIMALLDEHVCLGVDALKALGGFARADKARFDRALTELQMKLYITMCGAQRRISRAGEAYGWNATVFMTTERFWGPEVFEEARSLAPEEGYALLEAQIRRINPAFDPKKAAKFIRG